MQHPHYILGSSRDSSIWVLDKEHWIDGPELPEVYTENWAHCHVPLNSTTALFISKKYFIFYNFELKEWRARENPMSFINELEVFICVHAHDKQYQM